MDDRGRVAATLVGAVVVAAGVVASAGDKAAEARALLAELNQRWAGAEARMRVSIPLKDGREGDGWSESRWMMHEPVDDSAQRFFLKVRVSDRRAIGPLLAGDSLASGARFRAVGMGFEEPEGAKGLFLELEFADAPARMRWVFNRRGFSAAGAFDADELAEVERYLRFDAFELRPAAERLVAVAPTPRPTPAPPLPTPTAFAPLPGLEVTAAAVRPTQVRPGGEVRLIVDYRVTGLGPGETREVTETRRLAVGDRVVEVYEHRIARPGGMVTSELPVQVPFDAAPGVYAVGTTVRMSGVAASDTAFFVVTPSEVAP